MVVCVVEFYIFEGCFFCLLVDCWLSVLLKGQFGFVVVVFYVDYWNGLGWLDCFFSFVYIECQKQGVGVNGLWYVYMLQIVVNGYDWCGVSLLVMFVEFVCVWFVWV